MREEYEGPKYASFCSSLAQDEESAAEYLGGLSSGELQEFLEYGEYIRELLIEWGTSETRFLVEHSNEHLDNVVGIVELAKTYVN
ncbi:MAG: hypothetical protein ABIG93_01605 [archaeon]|nr:hypothetical protein [Nanoarchaeota archaeon]